MSSVNKAIILGNLGNDPETKFLESGTQITTISVATSETWKDKQSGEKKEKTEWHRITFFGRLAEISASYLKKGSKVYVEGSIETTKYQAKDGTDRYSTGIKGSSMKMLGGKDDASSQPRQQQGGHKTFDDDLDF